MISINMFVSDTKKALDFYTEAYGATVIQAELDKLPGNRFAKFTIGNDRFALADENSELGSSSPVTLGGTPLCLQLYVKDLEATVNQTLKLGAELVAPSHSENIIVTMGESRFANVRDPFGFIWSLTQQTDAEGAKPKAGGKVQHRFRKELADIDFYVDYKGVKAVCRWVKRNEMLIKKGANLVEEIPLNKDGSVGFAAKFTLQLREMYKDKIENFVTTDDIILKSVNEVGNFLYFAGTNSWLVLKDKDGKTIDEYSRVD